MVGFIRCMLYAYSIRRAVFKIKLLLHLVAKTELLLRVFVRLNLLLHV